MLTIGLQVQIKSISKAGVAGQKYIPTLDTIYTIDNITDNAITLKYEKGISTYRKGQLTLKIVTTE